MEIETEIEKRLGVVVVNPAYPPGDVRRYGAVADGETTNAGAEAAAQLVQEAIRS